MKIEFYCSSSESSPILKFIDKQTKRDQAVILRVLKEIEDHDFNAKGASFRQLEGKLWEIKINTPSGGYRSLPASPLVSAGLGDWPHNGLFVVPRSSGDLPDNAVLTPARSSDERGIGPTSRHDDF